MTIVELIEKNNLQFAIKRLKENGIKKSPFLQRRFVSIEDERLRNLITRKEREDLLDELAFEILTLAEQHNVK